MVLLCHGITMQPPFLRVLTCLNQYEKKHYFGYSFFCSLVGLLFNNCFSLFILFLILAFFLSFFIFALASPSFNVLVFLFPKMAELSFSLATLSPRCSRPLFFWPGKKWIVVTNTVVFLAACS